MPSSYTTPYAGQNPYVAQIAAALGRRGDIAAQGALSRGQAIAQAVQGIGETVAGGIQAYQREKQAAPARELQQLQLQDARRQAGATTALNEVLRATPRLSRNGLNLYDTNAISTALTERGFGAQAADITKTLEGINQGFLAAHQSKLALVQRGAQALRAAGSDPTLVLGFMDDLEQNGTFGKVEIDRYRQVIQADPANADKVLQLFTGPQELGTAAPGSTIYDKTTGRTVNQTAPRLTFSAPQVLTDAQGQPHVLAQGNDGQLYEGGKPYTGPAITGRAATPSGAKPTLDSQLLEAYNKGDQREVTRLLGLKKMEADATRNNTFGVNSGVPGDWTKTGDAFLQTIPAQWRTTVKKIANYEEDPTKVASMRGDMRSTLFTWVNQVNPAWDQSQYSIRTPTRQAFTTGTQGRQVNAMNTAIGHLDQLNTLLGSLGNGSFVPTNEMRNQLRTIFGSDKVTNFQTLKDALAGEVASILAAGGSTQGDREEAQSKINAANSPAQLAGYIRTQIPILGSKLAALNYQYHQAMGEGDSWSALSPESQRILQQFGFDPAHPTIGATAPPAGQAPPAPAGWQYVPKPGGGWTAVPAQR